MSTPRSRTVRWFVFFMVISVLCNCSSAGDEQPLPIERQLMTLRGHSGLIRGVAYSPDGQRLASGGRDNAIKVWEVGTAEVDNGYEWLEGGFNWQERRGRAATYRRQGRARRNWVPCAIVDRI